MNDLHATPSKALDEGRLQPVDKGVVVTPEIAACPFGHPFVAKYSRSAVQRVVWARGFADRYKVMCECGAEGPYGDTQKDALAAWNAHQSETGAALPSDGREAVARESTMIVIERDNGKPTVWCDAEIADIVRALNSCGLKTVASCSGHGHRPGIISLEDGRELVIARDFAEARKIDALFPININGDAK